MIQFTFLQKIQSVLRKECNTSSYQIIENFQVTCDMKVWSLALDWRSDDENRMFNSTNIQLYRVLDNRMKTTFDYDGYKF